MLRPLHYAHLCTWFTLLLGLSAPALATEPLRVVTEELPPFNMTLDGKLTGLCTEMVQAVLADVGETAKIQSMPWARAYDIAMNTENVLIYCMARTAEREQHFKWVGSIAQTDWYLFSLNPHQRLNSLDDARSRQIATVKDDAGEQYLIAQGFAVGRNLQSSNKYEHNYEKLALGRVDLWIANELNALYLVRHAGQDPVQVLHHALALPELGVNGMNMAFSLKTPDATVERFRAGLQRLRASGRYDAITRAWR